MTAIEEKLAKMDVLLNRVLDIVTEMRLDAKQALRILEEDGRAVADIKPVLGGGGGESG